MIQSIVLAALAVLCGSLRIAGNISLVFQALAHLYVGGLYTYGFPGRRSSAKCRFALGLAIGLTVLEAICFSLGVGR